MALISNANLQTLTDRYGAVYDLLGPTVGLAAGTAVVGTGRNSITQALSLLTGIGDYETQLDLNSPTNTSLQTTTTDSIVRLIFSAEISAINNHCRNRGNEVVSGNVIVDLPSYLTYYNITLGPKFGVLVTPSFASVFSLGNNNVALLNTGVMSPAITAVTPIITNPYATVAANGMGAFNLATNAYISTSTASVNTTLYSEVVPVIAVDSNLTGQTAASLVTISGTDDGGLTTTTWTGTVPQNQTSAISTTITPAVTAQARQTVAVASATGIVAGSVLTVDTGALQETVFVETVSGANITAVFNRAHAAGVAVTGKFSITTTPSVAGKRLRSISGITCPLNGATAGYIHIEGKQDRVNV